VRKLEELERGEQRERYIDIVNVHAAALNASQFNERKNRTYEDIFWQADDEASVDLMDQYGLKDKRNIRSDSENE